LTRVAIPGSRVTLSRLGFGCARIFGGSELRQATGLVDTALSCGFRHFDTAPAYGSEEVLGHVLAGVSDVTVTTKIGLPRLRESRSATRRLLGTAYRRSLRPVFGRFPTLKSRLLRLSQTAVTQSEVQEKRFLHRDEVLRNLEESLRRLRRASIDLYLIHEPDGVHLTDELRDIFTGLQQAGVIGAFGLAYGRVASGEAMFGTVAQGRFPGANVASPRPRGVDIYHGVIRHGHAHRTSGTSARELVAASLQANPACCVLVSASAAHQVRDIARALPHREPDHGTA
jgi:aryl-alcohol dehydrogenase-like predicted oxidoreductase